MKTTMLAAQKKNETISFNWAEIAKKYKKDPAGLEEFIKESKNDITLMLITATKKRKIVPDLLRKCASQSCFNQVIFNEDEIWGEIYLVICSMLQRWETYCRAIVLSNKKMTHATAEGDLRMNNENDLIGYFRNSLQNAFADLSVKHNAQKRAANEVSFSSMFPESDDENERSFEETIACSKSESVFFNSYKKDMIRFLRDYDRKNGTKLALVFVAMLNPRYNGAVTVIQNRLKINNKTFNDSKALIEKLLGEEFSDVAGEIMGFIDSKRGMFEDLEIGNKVSRKYDNRKKQKAMEDKTPKPRRLNVIYGQRKHPTEANKWEYYVTVMVDQSKTATVIAYSPQNWENIYKKEEVIVGKLNQMEKARPKLEKMIKKHLAEAKKISEGGSPDGEGSVAA